MPARKAVKNVKAGSTKSKSKVVGKKAAEKKTTIKKVAKTKKPVSKKKVDKNSPALLKKVRHFRNLGQKRVAMLFSGGPAPGANAVISTTAIQFLNDGYDVIGIFRGYQLLQDFDRNKPKKLVEGLHYKSLSYDDVTKIRQLGGSILRTSRAKFGGIKINNFADLANPKKTKHLYNVIDALEYLGISTLISVGGDGSLKTSYYLSQLGVPVIHIPKTIDNDYYGIPWTFGFFSAIERARQDLKVYNSEVRTTDCYFICETMGRKAGWYTLGAGMAGEAVRMIGPEEIGDKLDINALGDELVDLIINREKINKHYGVILVSEGLVDKLPEDQKPKTRDNAGNIQLRDAKIGECLAAVVRKKYQQKTGTSMTIKTGAIGYTTRCVEPSAFDVLLGSQLGMGAYQFAKKKKFGSMVSVGDELQITRVPFSKLIDKKTFQTKMRYVPMDGDFFKLAKSLEFNYADRGLDEK